MNTTVRKKISDDIILDRALLNQAGLSNEIDIVVQDRAILILPAVKEEDWGALELLGKDAVDGALENPSENHDRYLYGDK